jgi:hypothetical protein
MLTYTQVLFLLVVPPALVLAFLTRPIMGKMEVYKLLALVVIAFVYSTPWYLHLFIFIFIFRSELTRIWNELWRFLSPVQAPVVHAGIYLICFIFYFNLIE